MSGTGPASFEEFCAQTDALCEQLILANRQLGQEIGVEDPLDEVMFGFQPGRSPYLGTPKNVAIVAWTRCDGGHFALMYLTGCHPSECPLIWIDPMAAEYRCVGATLSEGLARLVFETEQDSAACMESGRITEADHASDLHLFEALRRHFSLPLVSNYVERQAELDQDYLPALQLTGEVLRRVDDDSPVKKGRSPRVVD